MLLQVEIGSIQSFIFEAARLRDWRGASALLSQIERRDVPALLRDENADLIRSGGGVVVIGVHEDDAVADRLEKEIVSLYRTLAPGSSVYSAHIKGNVTRNADMSALLRELSYTAASAQGHQPAADAHISLLDPLVRFCDSCGERPAMRQRTLGDTAELVCTTCEAKGSHGTDVRRGRAPESLISRFADYVSKHDADGTTDAGSPFSNVIDSIPDDLGAIAEVDSSEEIALILADGNRLGATIQGIEDLGTYRTFSEGIDALVTASVFEALHDHAPPRAPGGASARNDAERRLPWEILFLGGDDILLATAADVAVPVLLAICEHVETKSRELFKRLGIDRDHLSLAGGIAVSAPHMPIGALYDLTGQLESSAKTRTYRAAGEGREVSTVDIHRITSSGTTTLDVIRQDELRPRRKVDDSDAFLTMRPFTTDELRDAFETARRWKQAGLPTSKVQYLRQHLFESPAEATRAWTHVVGRSRSPDRRKAWHDLLRLSPGPETESVDRSSEGQSRRLEVRPPWIYDEASRTRRTHLLDIIDLMALLPGS